MAGSDKGRGARPQPMLWPRQDRAPDDGGLPGRRAEAAADAATPERITVPQWLRPVRLLPYLAAALAAQLGIRLRLRVEPGDADGLDDAVPMGSVAALDGTVFLAMDGDAAMELLSAVFGSDRAVCPPESVMLADLAPDSGSWLALGTLVRSAVGRAMADAGAEGIAPQPARLADARAGPVVCTLISMTGPGVQAMMVLRFAPAAGTAGNDGSAGTAGNDGFAGTAVRDGFAGTAVGDGAAGTAGKQAGAGQGAAWPAGAARGLAGEPADSWERRLDRLSRAVPVPVCLELHAQELPLAQVMRLGVGDVITLPAIRSMTMKVAGAPWVAVPMAALGGPDPAIDSKEDRP